jgi:origin recognition complex subunit 2
MVGFYTWREGGGAPMIGFQINPLSISVHSNGGDLSSTASGVSTSLENPTEDFLEDYFSAHSKKSVQTSNHTLSRLTCPRMDVSSVKSALKSVPCFERDSNVLLKEYKSRFDYWLFLMCKGFNILTYGLGSKHSVLEDFRIQILDNACHFVVNGFFPGLTIKQVLNIVTSEVLHHSAAAFKTNYDHARYIVSTLQANNEGSRINFEIYFIVHNIDGPSLRGESAQSSLSILAQSPYVHMLASIDHINAPLLWDQKTLSNFNWSWHDTTTYNRYIEEGSYDNCLLVQHTSAPGIRSLMHVVPSLTPNAQSLFKLLVKHQLQSGDGMSFQELYMKCRKEFLVNSDLALRTHLIEFTDHKLVKSRKGADGVENLIVPIDKEILTLFMEQTMTEE